MVFKRLLGALGVGGPSVDTVLEDGAALPGGPLRGQVHLEGGQSDVEIDHITLELVARVEAEYEDGEAEGFVVFERFTVGGGFRLGQEERRSVPFAVQLPWETPVTELYGQPLGIVLGVRTELGVAGAKDKGDLDALAVRPLPVQEAVLEALGQLGFGFTTADLELGHIHGSGQQLPFYQEIEMSPAPAYAGAANEIELTFLASPAGVEVIWEADRRGGFFTEGYDTVNRHAVGHDSVGQTDWNAQVDAWVRQLLDHHAGRMAQLPHQGGHPGFAQPGYGQPGFGHPGYGQPGPGAPYGGGHAYKDDSYGEHHGHSSGPGIGTAVAAGAAGLAVGAVAGYAVSEMLDDDGGDGGEAEAAEEEGGEEE
ncbi:sporulation-control protein [Streptomyces zhaozhouensis]|uniref:Sporulation-control protein n=1 Tax=Streptomyces zhaozhouensis TaxID=1300267 RepID=A0A286DU92_9ACTN|nr:sporulation protein [Streptomyces zhaozhouensis]SOD62229.1 sporulation-control protein [Streptomyces zhaozhouensis]